MVNLNDFIDPDLTANDVLHSSGYASAASSGMGASGASMSLERRRELANNRRIVGDYAHSQLGRRQAALKARTADQKSGRIYDASNDSFKDRAKFSNRNQKNMPDSGTTPGASVERRQRFIEPPSRGYNPYGQ